MRIAVIHKDDEIYAEIKPNEFVEALATLTETDKKKVQKAINRLIVDLKQKTLYK